MQLTLAKEIEIMKALLKAILKREPARDPYAGFKSEAEVIAAIKKGN